jgi:hypothetical protein
VSDRRYKLIKQGLPGSANFKNSDAEHGDSIRWDDTIDKWVLDDEYPGGLVSSGPPGDALVIGDDGKLTTEPRMDFIDPYVEGLTYLEQQTVLVNGWTMAANTTTTDYPAPQRIGQPFDPYQGASPEVLVQAKQVISGNRYTAGTRSFQISTYSIYTVTGQDYEVYAVEDPATTGIITPLGNFLATTTGWVDFSVTPFIMNIGTVLDLIAVTQAPDPAPTPANATYDYTVPQNFVPPVAGQMIHARSQEDVIGISYTDDLGGDQTALIQSLTLGDTIASPTITWTVQTNTPQTGYANIAVTPSLVDTIGIKVFTFTTSVAQPTDYMDDTDYWLTTPYTPFIQGVVAIDTEYSNATINNSAYGTNIIFTEISTSPDWDIVAPGDATRAQSTFRNEEQDWVRESTNAFNTYTVSTIDSTWTEIARIPTFADEWRSGYAKVTAIRTDAPDRSLINAYFHVWREGTSPPVADSDMYSQVGPLQVSFRVITDGNDIVAQVNGRANQDWDWNLVYFFRDV